MYGAGGQIFSIKYSRTGEGTKPLGFSLAPELSHPKLDHDSSPFDHSQTFFRKRFCA